MGRTVLVVPILHNAADLGSLAPEVRKVYEHMAGVAAWQEHQQAIESLWDAIEQLLQAAGLDFHRCRLYQDGLPVCGKEAEIVRDVAARRSRNHQLLVSLMERGATLEGTEDPKLLLLEYQKVKALLANPAPAPPDGSIKRNAGSTVDRDRFIGQRIDATLRDGETGLVFIGLLHRLEDFLPPDIQVRLLLPRPGSVGRSSGA